MGTVVLDSGVPIQRGLHVYAHCQRQIPGGVALLVVNNDPQNSHELILANSSARYTLDAATLQGSAVRLIGTVLSADAVDQLPGMAGMATSAGPVRGAPAAIRYLTISNAGNRNCNSLFQ